MPSPPASDAVRREWMRRVEAEYRSAALTHHIGLWLLQAGASPDLFERAQRIVGDELAHSDLSHAVYLEAGGDSMPSIPRETLELRRTPGAPVEHDLLLRGVEMFCLGETVAVRLFSRMREGCDVPVARRALDRIVRDEVSHRDFGWTLLEWMLESPAVPAYHEVLERELPAMLERVRRSYRGEAGALGGDAPEGGATEAEVPRVVAGSAERERIGEAERRWGLMEIEAYREAVKETFVRDYGPRFRGLGVRVG